MWYPEVWRQTASQCKEKCLPAPEQDFSLHIIMLVTYHDANFTLKTVHVWLYPTMCMASSMHPSIQGCGKHT